MKVDLHMHTSASDGTDDPKTLIELAKALGFDAVAITDHDTLKGVKSAIEAGRRLGVTVIPGIELSTGDDVEIHMLGYGVGEGGALHGQIAALRAQRDQRMVRMVEALNRNHINVTMDQVLKEADGGSLGRPHLARALLKKGYVRSVKEAFTRYLTPGKAGYIKREKLTLIRAIQLIAEDGGIPVLAHPGMIEMDPQHLSGCVDRWREAGLRGIEVYHPGHTDAQCANYLRLAREKGLLVTGGSDYHGAVKAIEPGAGLHRWRGMERDFTELYTQIR